MASFGRYTPGQGFQSVAPNRPSGAVGGALGSAINRGGTPTGGSGSSRGGSSRGGGGGGTTQPNLPKVDIKGNEVFIDGQGFSVIPGKMTEFLNFRGISGSSFQSTLDRARQIDSDFNKQSSTPKNILLTGLEAKKNPTNALQLLKPNVAVNTLQKLDFTKYTQPNQFVSTALKNIEKANTVTILLDENNKAKGIEYGGQSLTLKGFENKYGAKLLKDPKTGDFFFGTVGQPEKKPISVISADFKPITKEERQQVNKALLKSNIKVLYTGQVGLIDALSDTALGNYVKKESNWAYDKITSVTTDKLSKYAELAKKNATDVLNQSNLKTGNKKIDLTAKSLGYVSYFGGSAGAYALNMISGLGNLAAGATFKPKETFSQVVIAAPAMIKNSAEEINRTFRGNGTIEDFFGTALTLASVASTAASFSRYGSSLKNIKMNRQLKKDLPAIKQAVSQSQRLLKKQQLYTQRVFMENSNKWKTFGNAYQQMKQMGAKHEWYALSNKKASVILQKTVINNGNVRMTNFMVAKSTSEKILGILRSFKNRQLTFMERFPDSKKLSSYLSKVQARRAYTFIEVRGSKFVTAIDGKGNIHLLRNKAELANFIKNAKYGKFSFTGSRAAGGSIDTIMSIGKKGFIGSEGFSRFAFKKSAGITSVQKALEDKTGKVIKYKGGSKTPFTKTFGQVQEISQVQKQVSLPKNIAISKGVRTSVVGSQLKSVTKAIQNTIAKNDLALKAGFRAVVAPTGLMFFSKTGKLVSAREATEASNKAIDRTIGVIKNILSDNTKQSPITRISQGSSQKSGQISAQKSAQQSKQQQLERMQQASARSARTGFKVQMKPFEPKFKLPELDKRKNATIVKKILGSKLAPSYQIVIGSGKKVKKIGGRLSPAEAISKGAYTIDRTKERTVRIVPTKQKPNARFKINYLKQAGQKFRNFRYKNKKRVSYSSTRLIEKRKYFNDLERLHKRRR